MEEMNVPAPAYNYALEVIDNKSVILVRHFYADTGDVDNIYSNYLTNKITDNSI